MRWDLQHFAEKTERATPEQRSQARRKGRVARSADFAAASALISVVGGLSLFGGGVYGALRDTMAGALSFGVLDAGRGTIPGGLLSAAFLSAGTAVLPVLLLMLAVGVAVAYAQVGPVFSTSGLVPDLSKIDPIRGFSRMFSWRGVAEFTRAALKLAVIGAAVYATLSGAAGTAVSLTQTDPSILFSVLIRSAFQILMNVAGVFLLIAVADFFYQRFEYERSLRMSKEEVRDEQKRLEGNPLVRRRMRERGRAIARRRMLQKVPAADVVVANPTHYAVALRYDAATMGAPQVTAKGMGELALKIRQIAAEHDVPIVENRELARSLYAAVELDGFVPGELFQAVAEVLAYVYRLRRRAL